MNKICHSVARLRFLSPISSYYIVPSPKLPPAVILTADFKVTLQSPTIRSPGDILSWSTTEGRKISERDWKRKRGTVVLFSWPYDCCVHRRRTSLNCERVFMLIRKSPGAKPTSILWEVWEQSIIFSSKCFYMALKHHDLYCILNL